MSAEAPVRILAIDKVRARVAGNETVMAVVFLNHSTLRCRSQSLHGIGTNMFPCRLLYLGYLDDLKQGPGRGTRALAVKSD